MINLHNVLFRPSNLYEALFRQKLLGSGSETIVGTDYTPYLYRSAPSFGQPYNRQRPTVIGGSLGWNQLVDGNTNFNGNYVSVSYDSTAKEFTLTFTADGNEHGLYNATSFDGIPTGHKCLITCSAKASVAQRFRFYLNNATTTYNQYLSATYQDFATILNTSTANQFDLFAIGGTTDSTMHIKDLQIIDLTALFGSTVADAIYAMEQSTAGSGVAFFKNLFRDDYFPFNSGELMSVQTSAHRIYDAGAQSMSEYPLSNIVLRGVPKWIDGDLRYDGDRYLPNGTVERRYGVVDLGTLTWSGTAPNFYATAPAYYWSSHTNFICQKYEFQGHSSASPWYGTNRSIKYYYSGSPTPVYEIYIRDEDYNSIASFESAMSGVYLVYELATPTTESATPYTALQMADPQGTEEWVTSGVVPVGQETEYIQKS